MLKFNIESMDITTGYQYLTSYGYFGNVEHIPTGSSSTVKLTLRVSGTANERNSFYSNLYYKLYSLLAVSCYSELDDYLFSMIAYSAEPLVDLKQLMLAYT